MSERAPHHNGSHDDDAHALMGDRGYWHGYAYAFDHKRSAFNVVNAYALARSERLTYNGAYNGRERDHDATPCTCDGRTNGARWTGSMWTRAHDPRSTFALKVRGMLVREGVGI